MLCKNLLDFDGCAGSGELCFEVFCLFLGNAFFEGFGSAFNEVFCFFKAKAGDFTNNLDNAELAIACGCKDNVEFGLFFSGCGCGSGCAGNSYRSCGYAEFLFECLYEVSEFEYSKGLDFFKRRNYEILGSYVGDSDEADFGNAARIGKAATTLFLEGKVGRVYIIYNRFVSVMTQKPTIVRLLPLTISEMQSKADEIDTETMNGEYKAEEGLLPKPAQCMLFEPSAVYLAAKLIPSYINNAVYGALLESAAGELASRRMAMENATDNADEIIDDLSLAYNRARQGAITQEITEIVSGAEAIK